MAETRAGARGERQLTVGERSFTVLLTNRALADAERATGKSALVLAKAGASETISVADVAALLQAGLDAGRREEGLPGRAMAPHDAWGLMDALGFGPVMVAVLEALAEVLFYRPETEEAAGPPA